VEPHLNDRFNELGIGINYNISLVEMKEKSMMVSRNKGDPFEIDFNALVITPSQKHHDSLNVFKTDNNSLVNDKTLQHPKFNNVFALGGCANLPTNNDLYSCLTQSVVLSKNVNSYIN
jgi:sulfide:quinone oxidoreductase